VSWQDIVLASGGFVISLGILPTIRGPLKPPLATTLTLVAVLAASCVAFVTLGLWLTAFGVGLQGLLWGIVLAQTLRAARPLGEAIQHPVVTTPELGFEEFRPAD
jgi:hypothetical protein